MNKKMRVFPEGARDYEKVYKDNRYLSKFNMGRLQKPDGFESIKEYEDFLRNFLKSKSIEMWNSTVQTEWLMGNFRYMQKTGAESDYKSAISNMAFDVFTTEFVGTGYSFLTSNFFFPKIKSYFPDLFPNFFTEDPFKNPELYAFPFKNIPIEYLVVVYKIPERLDLLRHADELNMPRGVFLDFIINYIGKYNDAEGEDVFSFFRNFRLPVYVQSCKTVPQKDRGIYRSRIKIKPYEK